MTDNEIIKALECCLSSNSLDACWKCPALKLDIYCGECSKISNGIANAVVDLINRQNAELDDLKRDTIPKLKASLERANKYGVDTDNENLRLKAESERVTRLAELRRKDVDNLSDELIKSDDKVKRLKKENKRLHSEVKEKTETIDFLKDQADGWSIDFCNLKAKLNTARAEAVKEFAERLKVNVFTLENGFEGNEDIFYKVVPFNSIDDLVSEMVGETK